MTSRDPYYQPHRIALRNAMKKCADEEGHSAILVVLCELLAIDTARHEMRGDQAAVNWFRKQHEAVAKFSREFDNVRKGTK
jgi:hypothetical protein